MADLLNARLGKLAPAAVAVIAVLLWQAAVVRYVYHGNWTGLFCIGDHRGRVPPDEGAYVFKGSHGYDGQEYRIIAHDPFFQRGYDRYLDDARLRHRRILIPLLAYLCALGGDSFIDAAYIGLVALSIGLGVYWCGRFARARGRPAAIGLVFLVSAAALVSIDRMLLEAPLAALFMGFVVYAEQGEWRKAYVVAALALLTRETGMLLIAGAVLYFALRKCWRAAALFALAGAPALAWYGVVWRNTPPSRAYLLFTWPLWGHLRRLLTLREVPDRAMVRTVLHVVDPVALLGFLACLAVAVLWIRRDGPRPVQLTLALFVALGLVMGRPDHLVEIYGYARPVAPLLAYVLLRSVVERNWRTAVPPLLVSAGIGIYFVSPLWRVLRGLAG